MTDTQEIDDRLTAMFAAQTEALTMPVREWDGLYRAPAAPPPRRPRHYVLSAAVFMAVLGLVAVALRPAPDQAVKTQGSASAPAAPTAPFRVDAKQVSLAAQALLIEAGGKSFTTAPPLEVNSDPGLWNEFMTLELTWREHDVEMRLNVYFTSDGHDWWSNEIRTYDGNAQGEWIFYKGEFFRSPLGTAFVGDLDVTGTDHGVTGRLRLPGLRLEAFRRPAACVTPTAPYALNLGADVVELPLASDFTGGVAVTMLDTATCLPVANPGDFTYRWAARDPAVVTITPGSPGANLRPTGVGTTPVMVSAVDRSGHVVGEAQLTVKVVPAADSPTQTSVRADGPPPPP